MIYRLRTSAKMSQENFADVFKVSRQSVQKWESGTATPELSKLIEISKYFGISLDALVLSSDSRTAEEMRYNKIMKPKYSGMSDWEFYSSGIMIDYEQSVDEGLDIKKYKDLFFAVSKLPKDEIKKKLGDVLFEIINNAETTKGYKYKEPSELAAITALRKEYKIIPKAETESTESKIYGAWMGRICGCMLGKTVEGIRTNELIPFLKETNNYPMYRYIYKSDLNDEICKKYKYSFKSRVYADEIDGMPVDDDTNYVVLAQIIIDKYGRNFTPYDVSRVWLDYQSKNAYCTAERVVFCNFVKGYEPPQSAVYKNPYREWIGAQIRGDYFGYINPGNPEKAAEMAWRDASISHIKNGIYGEMFVAAMLAVAATTTDIEDIIRGGLAQIPYTSRLYEEILSVLEGFKKGVFQKDAFESIHKKYDEYSGHGWCHTIPNAMIVTAALLYGNGDYGKSICMAVETGFDTDCNGATVGSILGMANGIESIPEYWTKPVNDTLHTTIFGIGTVKISDMAKKTLKHVNSQVVEAR
ncbi:MAG: ADP-ribosylglycohydrolase family protein [Clostridiales bacterium]|nr:ADP-ribosylglycohydrolase family protein [Clostridiales bacterium]